MLEDKVALRRFLIAQLHWERYHAARVRLVNASAASALAFWLLGVLRAAAPGALLIASAACFLAAGFAAMMEWRWQKLRDRSAGVGGAR